MSQFFPSYALFLWGNILGQIQMHHNNGWAYLNKVQRAHYLGIPHEDIQCYSFIFMCNNRINKSFCLASSPPQIPMKGKHQIPTKVKHKKYNLFIKYLLVSALCQVPNKSDKDFILVDLAF